MSIKKVNRTVGLFIMFFLLLINLAHSEAGYQYPIVCENPNCYETDKGTIKTNKYGYFMKPNGSKVVENGLNNKIQNQIMNDILNKYSGKFITIKNYCESYSYSKSKCELNQDQKNKISYLENKKDNLTYDINKIENDIKKIEDDIEDEDYDGDEELKNLEKEIETLEEQKEKKEKDRYDIIQEIENIKDAPGHYDKKISINNLILSNKTFYHLKWRNYHGYRLLQVDAKYNNGKEYILNNFEKLVNTLHSGLPYGTKKNKLSDYITNFLNYNNSYKTISLKNVCDGLAEDAFECLPSKQKYISIYDNQPYSYIYGEIKPFSDFVIENFKVSDDYNIDSLNLEAGGATSVDFGFEDYLDVSSDFTEYEYRIYYSYDGEGTPSLGSCSSNSLCKVKEIIKVDNDTLKITSENLEEGVIDNLFNIKWVNKSFKKIRLGINERFTFTKAGKINFYLYAKNLNTGDEFDISKVNEIPLRVSPSNNIEDGKSEGIAKFKNHTREDIIKSKDPNSGTFFNVGDTFVVNINIKDQYGNYHKDTIDGYEISMTEGSSPNIKLQIPGTNNYADKIKVKSSNNSPYTIRFKFKVTSSGFHSFKGFNIKSRKKSTNDPSTYQNPPKYSTLKGVVPKELYDSNNQIENLYIKSESESDFDLSCTNSSITLETNCTSDNKSGCDPNQDDSKTFNSESDNGSTGTLTIRDYAYNIRNYVYEINHIDKTEPNITIKKGGNNKEQEEEELQNSYKANNDGLKIYFEEKTASECSPEVEYKIMFGSNTIKEGKKYGNISNIEINNFFKKATYGSKPLKIIVKDKYGNINIKEKDIAIYPNHPGLGDDENNNLNSTTNSSIANLTDIKFISTDRNSLFSNNDDKYIYEAKLKDDMGNIIKNKKVYELVQSCEGDSNCKSLYNNMPSKRNGNAITTELIDPNTGEDGIIRFSLKSKVPGIFNEKFKIKLDFWDNNYNNINKYNFITKNNNTNGFKKPFYGEFYTTLDNFERKELEIGQEYYFNLDVKYSTGIDENDFDDYKIISLANETYPQDPSTFVLTNIGTDKYKSNIISPEKVYFTGTFNYIGNSGEEIGKGKLITSPIIEHNIDGQKVKYRIGDSAKPEDKTLSIGDKELRGVKVIGQTQGKGRQSIYGMAENASSMSDSKIRNNLIKKATKLIQGMSPGEKNKGIIYKKGDSQISNIDYKNNDTIIVKNGNLVIDENVNKKIGIMLIRDEVDNTNIANVLIEPDINYINAIIFAQGGVKSNTNLNSELNEQLVIEGSLITWNTIGGGILSSEGKYILPSGERTSNMEMARDYDLNYLRRDVEWSSSSLNQTDYNEGYYNNPVIIKFDSDLSTNPPQGF